MRYESRGTMRGSVVEVLLKFCSVANASRHAFHPFFLEQIIEKYRSRRGDGVKFFYRGGSILTMVRQSYDLALEKHLTCNPLGQNPNKIHSEHYKKARFSVLQYTTFGGTTIRMTIPYPSLRHQKPCEIVISGRNMPEVSSRAKLAGLPEATLTDQAVVEIKEKPRVFVPSARPLPKIPLEPVLPVNLSRIMVPIGEFLDFLKKYQ